MTPEQRKAYIEKKEKEKVYLGNDRRATMAVSPKEHERIHKFEGKHRKPLADIPISPRRAYTTLVNKKRRQARREKLDKERRERTKPQLQARMAKAAEKHGIAND